ncbi:MAG: 2-dehydro-3-deoxy-D-gluconate 5-dehydrogenase KduD [Paraglaciecola sp.]|uniref:2-dehydro-3-deoxy-D-gluconate 5-dehydrogenase KduD n=1 Tax=Pseudomonadati TaxID=3379134 RepID=UPI00273DD4BE|nr:2-dehydro-3-deoxy-D-gluconate 5-dehydrogenase KduD [Paraglaciecola sp.]MDP5031114.1 2-dehydro-3-deoxy-D-gluconate 5-dehydrogenase KduD [Paraglaciecola sp.]MDP5040267.1 2-dehydro-3-deoxy-D-gluconate 5-dehydrogenase KduD [Paraglaciecola sp.]MDP5131191.1 2-dehydro-3-deoxy-D-gluconate 5-dehydrogenase KduD [Paraglaciecola sp.]
MNLSAFSLEHKWALVTGASRGLGQAIAVGLAEAGAKVICASSQANGCDETISMIKSAGGTAMGLAADLSNETAVRQLADDAKALSGGIDILINNGGTIFRQAAVDYPMAEWRRVMQVNLDSAFILSQLVGKDMIEKKHGKIINIASMLSYSGGMTVPAYTASKHAIAGLTKALANEWGQFNIQVNAIAPGYFKTDNTTALQNNEVRNKEITQRIPAGRWGEPTDLNGAAVFLASRASDYLNGHIMAVDGGWLAR